MISPLLTTMMRSALTIVDNLCATMKVVRFLQSRRRALWILDSVSVSTALVASCNNKISVAPALDKFTISHTSSNTIFGCFSIALAMATLCNSPPDSFMPRSPTRVLYPSLNVSIWSCMEAALHAS